ncbi:TetR/AcrR family transcriptional regulator [Dysgonomonas termitidis]|uniref:TetR/AcrR family transcriptional regulator n=1 Tax=Dysgonomonas termitidis TaxID=1516126 RepID=A0ABV9KUM0_9BACT
MTKGRNIKETIQEEAFRLFLSKPYDKVTYTDLEKATGFSRGAILHHFKTKLSLLEQVVDKYVFKNNSVFDLYNEQIGMSFLSFIHIYCDWVENRKREFRSMGVENYSLAVVNIAMQASYFYPGMVQKLSEFSLKEREIWSYILRRGIESGELRKDIDIPFIAHNLQDTYYGTAFTGLARPDGADIPFLRKRFLHIYESIKA